MRNIKIINNILVFSLLSALVACGGGGGSDGSAGIPVGGNSSAVLSGQVADGYLVGARVFLDRNGNQMLDTDEPWTESGAQGHFSLDIQQGEGNLYPVVAEIIAGRTIDEDLTNQYVGESYRLEAPVGKWSFISPLTTLVKDELDKNPSISLQDAEARIRAQLGLSGAVSLFDDYIQSENNGGLQNAHRAARIIAGLMGSLQTEIDLNVGVASAESQRAAISLMISDQIMNNSGAISQGLVSAVNTNAIENIKTTILTGINIINLNSGLLDRYIVRMQGTSQVWDMTPPKIISRKPSADGSASIDVVVSLTFDEEIDPSSISQNTIQITGPSGPVVGTVSYDPTLKTINFTTESYLRAFTLYQVDLAGIIDGYGNILEQTQAWTFTTIFDQLPPDLPVF